MNTLNGLSGGWLPSSPDAVNARIRKARMPNETLVDHTGRSVRFYDDVMKGNRVVINVMYTVCSNACTPAMRNLIEARRLLGNDGHHLKFVSLTLTPLSDTPEVLRAYSKQNEMPADWTLLTGKQDAVERVHRALGFLGTRESDDDLFAHSTMARYCEEALIKWTHVNTLLPARTIARMIRFEMI
jgi:protein SCO1/2